MIVSGALPVEPNATRFGSENMYDIMISYDSNTIIPNCIS